MPELDDVRGGQIGEPERREVADVVAVAVDPVEVGLGGLAFIEADSEEHAA